jgi:hypothetical protein
VKPSTAIVALVAQLAGVALVFSLQRWLSPGSSNGLPFVVGSILGTQLGALTHARRVDAQNTPGVKATLGVTLAAGAALGGLALHRALAPFEHPEITVGISVLGSAVFPFVLFIQMWRAVRGAR